MKVVFFCGGLGTRLREHSDVVPKPLVNVGNRPILWHLMKYYAHFGHKEFILCLGYKGEMVKEFFLNYDSYIARDFVMHDGGRRMDPENSDISDWKISFVDTGLHSNIGQRLVMVKDLIGKDQHFLATYSDQLTDFSLPRLIEMHQSKAMIASFLSVQPPHSFHHVSVQDDCVVREMSPMARSDYWVNGGYIVLNREIFDYIKDGEELVEQPFQRLIKSGKLGSIRNDGFWAAMDTFKDKIMFDRMDGSDNRPWEVWQKAK